SSIQSSSSSIASSSQSSSSSESSSTISSSSSISSSSLSSLSSSISSTSSQVSSSSSISSAIGGNIVFFEDFALFNPTIISSTYSTGEFTNSTGIIWKYTHVRNDGGTTGSGATNYTNPNNIPNPPTLPTPVIRNSNITLLMSSEIDIPESGNYSIYFQYHQPFTTGLNFIFQLTASDTNTIIYQTNIAITNRAVLYEFGPIQLNITSPQQIRFVFRPKGGGQTAIDNITVKKE
ncbi:MAG: hypothetical protein N2258_04995, partial [Brevinematales bacterium]|nr:hypothetical protein [Brevinematales bacterium]